MKAKYLLGWMLVVVALGAQADEEVKPGFNESTFKGLELRSVGPAFMSGRIADIVIDESNPST